MVTFAELMVEEFEDKLESLLGDAPISEVHQVPTVIDGLLMTQESTNGISWVRPNPSLSFWGKINGQEWQTLPEQGKIFYLVMDMHGLAVGCGTTLSIETGASEAYFAGASHASVFVVDESFQMRPFVLGGERDLRERGTEIILF